MTALTLGSAGRRAARPARRQARVLRLEIKHSPGWWVLPLLAALFYFDTDRTAAGLPAIWTLRASVITDHLVATTAHPAWSRQAAALAGTLSLMLLGFLGGVAVLYIQTARAWATSAGDSGGWQARRPGAPASSKGCLTRSWRDRRPGKLPRPARRSRRW
jgi:hypothetical protein